MRTVFRAFCLESGATCFSHVLSLITCLFFVSFLFKIGAAATTVQGQGPKEEDAPDEQCDLFED